MEPDRSWGETLEKAQAHGKFVRSGQRKLSLRGVTYGTFRPSADGCQYPAPSTVATDFAAMRAHGINTVRTYSVPPRWLLDLAEEAGLFVLVGVAWEQHVTFLSERGRTRSIADRVRKGVRECAGHPAVLAYAIGNEIPASIVRWHGRRRIEQFLEELYRVATEEDPDTLVTYVNYPSTEYLQLPFLDLVCFNVFLEAEEEFGAYLARLQTLAGNRPLVITELGLDGLRNGDEAQADSLAWQLSTAFAAGCAGAFVFAWTDEWNRGGADIDDWRFGLTRADRSPKPALAAVEEAFATAPLRHELDWPRISVVVCTYNGAATIAECLEGCTALDYPNFEVLVIDDGSTDRTAELAVDFDVRVISTENRGLAAARNVGLRHARGEIVAYLDDDASPDPDWLRYLAAGFMTTPHAAIGGPNVPPANGFLADCIAKAPGGPIHVLVSDREAEHIPGCNMAFRREVLDELGGFDARFRIAGDDVDICWRLQNAGWTIGFAPAAMVWHRRRESIRGYARQQREYGKAEALLERKWPERYNRSGHVRWSGNVYRGQAQRTLGGRRWRIYYGTWGSGLFQSIYERAPGTLASLPLMPEWHLLIAVLAAMTVYGFVAQPLLFAVPALGVPFSLVLFAFAVLALAWRATWAARAALPASRRPRAERMKATLVITYLHLIQPPVRLYGRLRHGLTPWRTRGARMLALPVPRNFEVWSESWESPAERLVRLAAELRLRQASVLSGGSFDSWDFEVRGGVLGAARMRMAVEEHGLGRQLLRFRIWPRVPVGAIGLVVLAALFAALAASRGSLGGASIFGALTIALAVRILRECAAAVALLLRAPAEQEQAEYTLPTVLAERARHAGLSEREIFLERGRAANLRGGGKG
jgi:GT2 family glycosyltransferase